MKQEYLYKVITQEQEISGPPRYLTTDWKAAKESVITLEKLKPLAAVTGHGLPMSGELLSTSLNTLVQEFDKIAVPDYGKYVDKREIKQKLKCITKSKRQKILKYVKNNDLRQHLYFKNGTILIE